LRFFWNGEAVRILLVDKDIKERMALGLALTEAGWTAHNEVSLTSLTGVLSRESYDAVILGAHSSKIAGKQMLQVRAFERDVPILAIGDRDGENDIVQLLESGADDVISRPIHMGELIARTRALIRRGPSLPGVRLRVSDLEIDSNQQAVFCRGQPVGLSPLEYKVLQFLASHLFTIVAPRRLSKHLYGGTVVQKSNVVEAHVSNLRRKLHDAGSSTLIEAVRGTGYRLRGQEVLDSGAP